MHFCDILRSKAKRPTAAERYPKAHSQPQTAAPPKNKKSLSQTKMTQAYVLSDIKVR